jgi:tRNA(fMet)-specific endonuclease VapC
VTRYMLDTNMVSHLINQHPSVVRRVVAMSMASLCISAITAGELLFGLAKRPAAARLHLAVRELLRRIDVVAWDNAVALRYGTVRADLQHRGKTLAAMDVLIATHALANGAILVTDDRAFGQVTGLEVEDWSA